MDGKKSKFDYCELFGGYDDFAINSCKHTMSEAVEIYRREMDIEPDQKIAVGNAFVRHHAGINEDGEPCVGWWLEYEEHKTSCPVYTMHISFDKDKFESQYTIILPESPKEE